MPEKFGSANAAYLERWLGEIASRAESRGARLATFALPRCLYHAKARVPPELDPALAKFASEQRLRLLDPASALAPERPETYFAALHLSALRAAPCPCGT